VEKSNGKLYWYGMNSDPLSESDLSGNITDDYIFFNGKRIARQNISSGNRYFYFSDHLGTTRVIAQAGISTACYDADYYPFGGEAAIATNTCSQVYKFTGKERDSESGFDYFGVRYDNSSLGRFTSPDPKILGVGHLANPQKWNKYTYALDNPLAYFDLDGQEEKSLLGRVMEAVFVRVGTGGGLGVSGKVAGVKVKAQASVTVEAKISPKGAEISNVKSAQAGAEAKVPGVGEVTLGPKISQKTVIRPSGANVDIPQGQSKPEPVEKSLFFEVKGSQGVASSNELILSGVDICAGVCGSAEVGVDLKKLNEIFGDPGPPQPPNPPAPMPPVTPTPPCSADPNRKCS